MKLEATAAPQGEEGEVQELGQEQAAQVSTQGRGSHALQGCEVEDRGHELGVKLEVVAATEGEGQAQELGQEHAAKVRTSGEGMWVVGSPDALQKLA